MRRIFELLPRRRRAEGDRAPLNAEGVPSPRPRALAKRARRGRRPRSARCSAIRSTRASACSTAPSGSRTTRRGRRSGIERPAVGVGARGSPRSRGDRPRDVRRGAGRDPKSGWSFAGRRRLRGRFAGSGEAAGTGRRATRSRAFSRAACAAAPSTRPTEPAATAAVGTATADPMVCPSTLLVPRLALEERIFGAIRERILVPDVVAYAVEHALAIVAAELAPAPERARRGSARAPRRDRRGDRDAAPMADAAGKGRTARAALCRAGGRAREHRGTARAAAARASSTSSRCARRSRRACSRCARRSQARPMPARGVPRAARGAPPARARGRRARRLPRRGALRADPRNAKRPAGVPARASRLGGSGGGI